MNILEQASKAMIIQLKQKFNCVSITNFTETVCAFLDCKQPIDRIYFTPDELSETIVEVHDQIEK